MPASRHHMAAGKRPDALLLEHDLVAPVVDRNAGERPRHRRSVQSLAQLTDNAAAHCVSSHKTTRHIDVLWNRRQPSRSICWHCQNRGLRRNTSISQ